MIYHINYSDKNYLESRIKNTQSARKYSCFDEFISLSPDDLDVNFKNQHKKILKQYKGAGYWLWKPYIILEHLKKINDNDIIFYTDAGSEIISDPKPLIDLLDKYNQDIIPFNLELKNYMYTKRDTFILMNADDDRYHSANQCCGGFLLVKKSALSMKFFEDYLKFASDERIITDIRNVMGQPNLDGFISHRHDQAIFSILVEKYKFQRFRNPSQFGEPFKNKYSNSDYNTIINETRNRVKDLRYYLFKMKEFLIKS